MAVVINEFETVPAEPNPAAPANGNSSQPGPPSDKELEKKVAQAIQKHAQRRLRCWAH